MTPVSQLFSPLLGNASSIAQAPLLAYDHFAEQERTEQQAIAEQLGLTSQDLDKLDRKVQALISNMPHIHHESKLPYVNDTELTMRKFCRTVYTLAKRVSNITYPNSETLPTLSQLKQLRILTLDTLLEVLKYQLETKLLEYSDLPPPDKPNYDRYHAPLVKSAKKVLNVFKKIMETLNNAQTEEIYDSKKIEFDRKNATISILEDSFSKCGCCGIIGIIQAKYFSKNDPTNPFINA